MRLSEHAGPESVRVVNLTPHPVRVVGPGGVVDLPSEGSARVRDHATPAGRLGRIDLVELATGEVEGLPVPRDGLVLLVSRVVALARPDRVDLVFPFGEIRDERGRIVAVSALARLVHESGGGDRSGEGAGPR